MAELLTGKEICGRYSDLQHDAFGTEDHQFKRITIEKEKLYDVPCSFSNNGKNLVTYKEWANDPENYDDYHTDNVKQMVDYLQEGGILPPMMVNRDLSLYDGQHRLTAYSLIPEIKEVEIYKEV
ncbi:ParB N-terminal domain-containing protein [Sporolactobacillus shoreicorticis]|uniref:ParB N-terminal domain-containing protein n=1 Tax=Sporolactobacillus shoreicorticis TaxID=1923877 RepID=A0ABW5S390_9BACL|nr:ParB N-terminal domain-containing protein [Sporolactobacillus shoreicorticis]MCO7127106.1 ParB N-terminal domain-containing protein [Sporolactobacillus shoreicorticis]